MANKDIMGSSNRRNHMALQANMERERKRHLEQGASGQKPNIPSSEA